jgi:hypothetical protein
MANPTTNYGFIMPSSTDLVTDLPADFDVFGQAVDTQMLTNADAAISKAIVDAKGDIIAATADNVISRLAVGADDTVLTADSSEATGLRWAAAAGGGKLLQVVSALITTDTTIASTTLADSGITLAITPSSATSKVLVMISANFTAYRASEYAYGKYKILRGATTIWDATQNDFAFGMDTSGGGVTYNRIYSQPTLIYLDSPATTSSTTYKLQAAAYVTSNSGAVRCQVDGNPSSITLLEIGA